MQFIHIRADVDVIRRMAPPEGILAHRTIETDGFPLSTSYDALVDNSARRRAR